MCQIRSLTLRIYRMAGPILRGEHRVSWASRTDSPPQRRSSHQSSLVGDSPPTTRRDFAYFGSPGESRQYESPLPVSPDPPPPLDETTTPRSQTVPARERLSAPAEMHQPHHKLSLTIPHAEQSLDSRKSAIPPPVQPAKPPDNFELDRTAPARHRRERGSTSEASGSGSGAEWGAISATPLAAVEEEEEKQGEQGEDISRDQPREEGPVWGETFKVEWIRTDRLPFHRTRHLRNPWNHDREVKVSRDGTELEPSVGQALLDEWNRPDPDAATSPTTERRPASSRATGEVGHPPAAGEGG